MIEVFPVGTYARIHWPGTVVHNQRCKIEHISWDDRRKHYVYTVSRGLDTYYLSRIKLRREQDVTVSWTSMLSVWHPKPFQLAVAMRALLHRLNGESGTQSNFDDGL